ncbi:salicylate hydroxylase [Exophiala aquamarina CBS 119918]|uniref:Salicylate hydroxylase n=1 Tax=Exophiala aquamarina CBS 119918 TaxID=1182545 RepID=A0A072PWI9_9EURO|nr:salicylate hydroxylase [Exophiala aquamarina CBS 119918]KEF63723.1 salicylate hydroxylase [Exophiala aquamarina CBS 119918]
MHRMLMESALGEGDGIQPELRLDYKLTDVDFETGRITFANGTEGHHDAVVAADGVAVCTVPCAPVSRWIEADSHCSPVHSPGKDGHCGRQETLHFNMSACKCGQEASPSSWIHQEYPFWANGLCSLMGDAAHPMMPDQSQGACQAIEDAAALGLAFSKAHFRGDVQMAVQIFEKVRKPRATKVQSASARARLNITERIGFSSNTSNSKYSVPAEKDKLTIDEMNTYDIKAHVAEVYKANGL